MCFQSKTNQKDKGMIRQAGVWRNGSASDSRSEGWEFESLCAQFSRLRGRALANVVVGCTELPGSAHVCAEARLSPHTE